ncbi:MAG TPA: hypothetical protein VK151_13690 [Fluviicola sp.]|nr:hypothetical protein [Fluviicola sp.]
MTTRLLVIALIPLLVACESQTADLETLKDLQHNHDEFEKADYSFGTGDQYFRLEHFDLEALTDTLEHCHARIFTDKKLLKTLNEDITAWLRDSVFIGKSKTMKGTFILDTTNLQLLQDPLNYYMEEPIRESQPVAGTLFHTQNSMHTAWIDGKAIYYDIVPANAKWVKETGQYRIETTGDYLPGHLVNGDPTKSDMRYFCDQLQVDWFITIRSDDFFDGQLAIKLSDATYHYTDDFLRQK